MAETPALEHFIASYAHEDWAAVFGDMDAAVDAFVSESPTMAAELPAEVDRLLAEVAGESAVEGRLDEWGVGYVPDDNYRLWLTRIAERVRRATESD